ncbi:MAG: MATE family efflux transporter, partial [Oscillospiraceae bacterium]|nr:MATE family efflux transporter [Oscillospiraceae bacterium]
MEKTELFTRRALITLLIPLFIEQSLAMTIGIADTIMVSSVGEAAVSSVSLVDNINLLLSNIFTALASGGAVIVAQYIGRGDRENANTAAKQLIYASIILTIFITVVSISFNQQILRLIFGKIDADVMTNAEIYYYITAASYPFLALYNAGAALFRVMRNTKVSMFTSIIMNIISISGNAITIFIFKMGVTGAALTTLLARIVGAVIILILITNKSNTVFVEKIFKPQINFNMIKKILNIGIPNGLENGMFQIGKLLVAGIITIFG